METNAAFIK